VRGDGSPVAGERRKRAWRWGCSARRRVLLDDCTVMLWDVVLIEKVSVLIG
jgi:hypothetical protein